MSVVPMPGMETVWKRELGNRDATDTYVYIIGQLSTAFEVIGPVKIGISNNPLSRLQGVQTGSPSRLVLVDRYCFWKRTHAMAVERCFHQTCGAHRLEGEWFDITPGAAAALMEQNVSAFVDQVLQPDDTADWYFATSYHGLSKCSYDLEERDFRYGV